MQCQLAAEEGHKSKVAVALLDSLCRLYLAEPKALLKLAHHFYMGPMIINAGYSGLPRPACVQVRPCHAVFWQERLRQKVFSVD